MTLFVYCYCSMDILSNQITGFVHQAAPLPGIAWAPVKTLSFVHWCWRWNQKNSIYTNPDNWLGLAAGNMANMVAGDGWLRSMAHIILITHRTKQYIQRTHVFFEKSRDFKAALTGAFIKSVPIEWEVPQKFTVFSSNSWNKSKQKMYQVAHRIFLIGCTFFLLLREIFELSMHAVEIYDAFYRKHEAFNEVFINAQECLNDVMKSTRSSMQYVKENREVIQLVFDRCAIEMNVDKMIASIENLQSKLF